MKRSTQIALEVCDTGLRGFEAIVLCFYLYGYGQLYYGSGATESALGAALWAGPVFAKIVLPTIVCASALVCAIRFSTRGESLSAEAILRVCGLVLAMVAVLGGEIGPILHFGAVFAASILLWSLGVVGRRYLGVW